MIRWFKCVYSLWLFDVCICDMWFIDKVDMVKFDGYVFWIVFSNDGIYLVVVWSDNIIYVYDFCFLS